MKKNFLLIFTGLVLLTSMAGCHTLSGFGEDVKTTGGNIQETVDKND